MVISGLVSPSPVPFAGSELVPVTWNDPGASPESASDAVTVPTDAIEWLAGHRTQFAGGRVSVGGVLSMLMPPPAVDALLPARPPAVPERDWLAPSAVTTCGVG